MPSEVFCLRRRFLWGRKSNEFAEYELPMNRYHKSADPKTRKIKKGEIWSSTIKNLRNRHCYCRIARREKSRLAAGNQLLHDCRLESRKAKEGKNCIGQNAVERARTCHAARNTGAEKSEVKLHNKIMLPQLNAKFPMRKLAY